jgi:hypothetical protein
MTTPLVGEWPGAAALCPGLVAVGDDERPGAAALCPGLVALGDDERPGAAALCPGLVALGDDEWPGAAPERPGLVALVAEWPGALPECPGLLETELEEPVACTAVRARAGRAVEVDMRPPAGVGMTVRAVADDRVRTVAETPRCCTARAAGDTAGAGVRR